jgi:hypothetical protein
MSEIAARDSPVALPQKLLVHQGQGGRRAKEFAPHRETNFQRENKRIEVQGVSRWCESDETEAHIVFTASSMARFFCLSISCSCDIGAMMAPPSLIVLPYLNK